MSLKDMFSRLPAKARRLPRAVHVGSIVAILGAATVFAVVNVPGIRTRPAAKPATGADEPSPAFSSESPTPSPAVSPSPTAYLFGSWKTYEEATYHFSFEYPDPWFVDDLVASSDGVLRRLYTAEKYGEAGGQGGIEIDVCERGDAATLDAWITAHATGNWNGGCGHNDVRTRRNVHVAGRDAISFDWYPGEGGGEIRETTIALFSGAQVVTFQIQAGQSASHDDSPLFQPTLDHVVASFRDAQDS